MMQGNASMWQVESQMITQGGAVAFLIIASGSLLLLYLFLDKAVYIILVSLHTDCACCQLMLPLAGRPALQCWK